MPVVVGEEFTMILSEAQRQNLGVARTTITGTVLHKWRERGIEMFVMVSHDNLIIYHGPVPIIEEKVLPPLQSSKF